MLLTRKTTRTDRSSLAVKASTVDRAGAAGKERPLVDSLARGLARAMPTIPTMDRRTFLRRSGLGVGIGLATSQLTLVQKKAVAAEAPVASGKAENIVVRRTVCTHCSVGCAADAIVDNGVWVRQEPVFDSPLNLGAHCAKGAALKEHGHGEYRLRYWGAFDRSN